MRDRKLIFTQEGRSDEINVSPLIDIVFILLIFFIVTTVFIEETGVEVQRPQSASAEQLEKNAILIAITATIIRIHLNQRTSHQQHMGTHQDKQQQKQQQARSVAILAQALPKRRARGLIDGLQLQVVPQTV